MSYYTFTKLLDARFSITNHKTCTTFRIASKYYYVRSVGMLFVVFVYGIKELVRQATKFVFLSSFFDNYFWLFHISLVCEPHLSHTALGFT